MNSAMTAIAPECKGGYSKLGTTEIILSSCGFGCAAAWGNL